VTTEDDFQKALDAQPGDWQTRLVFADWLQERGDPRAEGYRALGQLRTWPYCWYDPSDPASVGRWLFHNGQGNEGGRPIPRCHVLPQDWLNATAGRKPGDTLALLMEYDIKVEVPAPRAVLEDAVALGFARLSARRRAEILASPPLPQPRPARKRGKPRSKP
jgi:uncharacterized protein (TIGR02996 family)